MCAQASSAVYYTGMFSQWKKQMLMFQDTYLLPASWEGLGNSRR
jgi:hypothetical protein